MIVLCQDTVNMLPPDVARPRYDRRAVRSGIVHVGVGGFHRAHQAVYLDSLMNEGKALDWGITGVGVLPADRRMRDALTAQDCLYTLVVKDPDGTLSARVIGSIVAYLYAPDDPEKVIETMADESTRIVSLTVTEGGYNFHAVTGAFDATNPEVVADLSAEALPRTVFGLVTEALRRRRKRGLAPFAVLSCDNIEANGDAARRSFATFARLRDDEFGDWVEANVPFPNCMVDRITPVTTEEDREELARRFGIRDAWPVVCEPFTQWVVEDRLGPRPPLEEVGVQFVEQVEPYELMKLRLLNVGHQALGYFGYLSGYRLVHDAAQDPLFAGYLLNYMKREATPTLQPVPGVDLDGYQAQLIARFSNGQVRDTLARLCAESSDRIPKWVLPVIRHNLEHGGEILRATAIVASWARYAEAVDEQGEPIRVVDRLSDRLTSAARLHTEDPLAFLRDGQLFGDLVDDERFVTDYLRVLDSLHHRGARRTLEDIA